MDDIEAFERSTNRKRQVRMFILAAVIASPFLYLGWSCKQKRDRIAAREEAYERSIALSAADKDEMKRLVTERKQVFTAARAAWTQLVTREALAAITPGDAPCSYRFTAPTAQAADSYREHGSIDGNYFGNASAVQFAAGAPLVPRDLDADLRALAEAERLLATGEAKRPHLDALRPSRSVDKSVFIVVDRETAPVVMGGVGGVTSFVPGELAGTAYVFAYDPPRIACAGPIAARNGESFEFAFSYMEGNVLDEQMKADASARATLQRDLEIQVRRALATSLRAVP